MSKGTKILIFIFLSLIAIFLLGFLIPNSFSVINPITNFIPKISKEVADKIEENEENTTLREKILTPNEFLQSEERGIGQKITQKLISIYLSKKEKGEKLTDKEIEKIFSENKQNFFEEKDLIINDNLSQDYYQKNIFSVLEKFKDSKIGKEIPYFANILSEVKVEESINVLQKIADDYKKMALDSLKIQVPTKMVFTHLNFVNGAYGSKEGIIGFLEAFKKRNSLTSFFKQKEFDYWNKIFIDALKEIRGDKNLENLFNENYYQENFEKNDEEDLLKKGFPQDLKFSDEKLKELYELLKKIDQEFIFD